MHTKEILDNLFTYHAPKPGQPEKYQAIRDKAKELALLIADTGPTGTHEVNEAFTKIQEAVMWANANIARNGT